ncbi:hypothetical protein DIPPA_29630 [Diplonema papillatum]|nr:hypothetical protein DIPPA_29630 [Diplonema papillatum]
MRGIKWMLGRTDEESWRGKKVVIVFGSAAPMSPGASARLGEWIRDAGYETLDLSSYLPTDPDSVDAALKELAETEQDGVVVMTAVCLFN